MRIKFYGAAAIFAFIRNLGHTILELYNVLVEIRLTTSEKKKGYVKQQI